MERRQCELRSTTLEENGCVETSRIDVRHTVLEIFCRHYNAHPLIPNRNRTYLSPEAIHRESATEMDEWGRTRNYYRLWVYLYVNWYKPGQWELWARSMNPQEIPVPGTAMVVESHWRKIKHDYLHHFNRPRIDVVLWVLTSQVVPNAINRMEAICKATASWRKAFNKQMETAEGPRNRS